MHDVSGAQTAQKTDVRWADGADLRLAVNTRSKSPLAVVRESPARTLHVTMGSVRRLSALVAVLVTLLLAGCGTPGSVGSASTQPEHARRRWGPPA